MNTQIQIQAVGLVAGEVAISVGLQQFRCGRCDSWLLRERFVDGLRCYECSDCKQLYADGDSDQL